MQTYKYITYEQRAEIALLHKQGLGPTEIGKIIDKDKSVISRELRRNCSEGKYHLYNAPQAQKRYLERSQNKGRKTKLTLEIKEEINSKLSLKWSPEQISGRSQKDGIPMVSHESIYLYIYEDKRAGGFLYKDLRQSHRTRRKRRLSNDKRGQITDRVSIKDRPAIVTDRSRLGDWEGDTIVGKNHKSNIGTIVDRVSKLTVIVPLKSREASETANQIVKEMQKINTPILTITFDNGKEFANHKFIEDELKANVFFADPYSSYQRGTNENTNGLIRQFFPKGTDFNQVNHSRLKDVENLLNNRPRKTLGYLTPIEYIYQSVAFKT